jgi:hypothetical protein
MHPIQSAYLDAKARKEALEEQAMTKLQESGVLTTPDWDLIATTQEQIERDLGIPASRLALKQATENLEQFALVWTGQYGTAEDREKVRRAIESPISSVTGFKEDFFRACLNLPVLS